MLRTVWSYILFIVDDAGVPSVAHWMRVGPARG